MEALLGKTGLSFLYSEHLHPRLPRLLTAGMVTSLRLFTPLRNGTIPSCFRLDCF